MGEQQGVSAGVHGAGLFASFGRQHNQHDYCTVLICSSAFPRAILMTSFTSNSKPQCLVLQVHRGIKGVVRDKDSDDGIAGAVIEVEDIDHHIRSGMSYL